MKVKDEYIKEAISNLNKLTISGLDNMERVLLVAKLITTEEKEEKEGKDGSINS